MLNIEKSFEIDAPTPVVFAYATDPARQPMFFTDMHEMSGIERLPNGGHRFSFAARVAGIPIHGCAEQIEFVPTERVVVKLAGSLEGTETVTFTDEGGKTRVRCAAEYALPRGLLGKLGAPLFARYLNHHIEDYYAALKARIEGDVPARVSR